MRVSIQSASPIEDAPSPRVSAADIPDSGIMRSATNPMTSAAPTAIPESRLRIRMT